MVDFKYEVGDSVEFSQGEKSWDSRGTGKVLILQEYPTGNVYLIQMLDGYKLQVLEEQILNKVETP